MVRRDVFFLLFCLVFATVFFCPLVSLMAAQSTADAVADAAMKESLRKEVVGSQPMPGEDQEYVIGYGDVLGVSIYGEGDMAASGPWMTDRTRGNRNRAAGGTLRRPGIGVEVRLDGRISLQHVGDVNVVGMTLTQLADYLKKLYATVYGDPVVTTVLIQSNSRRYTVMGQVTAPGIFYLDYPVTIVQAIARSGGFTEWASHNVTIVRAGDGIRPTTADEVKMEFDYDELVNGKKLEKNIFIESGDVVVVH